jgi:hypothetical protein
MKKIIFFLFLYSIDGSAEVVCENGTPYTVKGNVTLF